MNATTKLSEKTAHAWSLIKSGQFEAARRVSGELSKKYKNDPQSWYLFALASSQLKRYPEAISGYKKTLSLAPEFVEANYNLALTYQLSGLHADAIKYFRKTLNFQPALADAHFGVGNCLYALGQHEQAADAFKTTLLYRPDFLNATINLGIVQLYLGDFDAAEATLLSATKQQRSAVVYLHLGRLYQAKSDLQNALANFKQALEIDPTYAVGWAHLGGLYMVIGQLVDAKNACIKALEHSPDLIDALYQLAAIHFQVGDLIESQSYYEKVLMIDSKCVEAIVGLGSISVSNGDYVAGLRLAEQAYELDGTNANAVVLKAKINEQLGNLDEALNDLAPLLEANIFNAAAGAVYANICHSKKDYQRGIVYLEKLLKHKDPSSWERQQLHFALGKLFDAAEQYDEAFAQYEAGNNQKLCNYSPEAHEKYIDSIIKAFPQDYYNNLPRSSGHKDRPVFIVGMPRSGTSLVEQILSRHSHISAGGELTFLHDIAHTIRKESESAVTYPGCLEMMTGYEVTGLAASYLEKTLDLHSRDTLLTDKLPANFLHLGLISLLFPSAIIIHCRRNPVDTCLSCYFQDFIGGELSFTYNLNHLAHYYREYTRLIDHWETVLEIPMLQVNYEDLIENQERESREIVEFCGLDWEPQCLEFSKSNRFVRTASYGQVRRPIYASSVERWKHYQKHITPLLNLFDSR